MCKTTAPYNQGSKEASKYELWMPLLKSDKAEDDLQKQKASHENYGRSILTNRWIDKKRNNVTNLLVHCKLGMCFIKSIKKSA